MKKLLLVAAFALAAGPLLARPADAPPAEKPAVAAATTGAWTGYITDTHCGRKGASKDHTTQCVIKCMKAGSKAQIWNEADDTIHDLDSFEKVKDLVGQKVTIKGTLDPATNTIAVASAEKAAETK